MESCPGCCQAYGDRLHRPETVKQAFGKRDIEWLVLPNDPVLREVATFLPLLIAAYSEDREHATFYAHTKGNATRDNARGAKLWRNKAYHYLLDHADKCMAELAHCAAVGTHLMSWDKGERSPYPTALDHGTWMFAGTFFWFRNDVVYSRDWRRLIMDRYGAEAYLSGILSRDEVRCVYNPWGAASWRTKSP